MFVKFQRIPSEKAEEFKRCLKEAGELEEVFSCLT